MYAPVAVVFDIPVTVGVYDNQAPPGWPAVVTSELFATSPS
jgi:hypothetical protein